MSDHRSAAAVAPPDTQTVPRRRSRTDKKPRRQPRYHVLLWNDDDHSPEYVILMLQELFGHPPEKGYQIAEEVHHRGKAICLTTTREHAELKRDQIHAYGKDAGITGCAGSMSCTIEPDMV